MTSISNLCWIFSNLYLNVCDFFTDVDSNGYLDERDFACLALRATIIEGKGEFSYSRLQENQHIMLSLWEEIAELADFNKVRFFVNLTIRLNQRRWKPKISELVEKFVFYGSCFFFVRKFFKHEIHILFLFVFMWYSIH